jgi:hypothetical protein
MGEDEYRCVEWRVGAPCALPVRFLVPSRVAELPSAHDLRAEPGIVLPDEGVVDAAATAGCPPSGGEHPLVQPISCMTEMGIGALAFGAEAIERDGEVLDANA